MRAPKAAKISIIPLTLISLFTLPWALTLIGMGVSGVLVPLAPLGIGVLADVLYYPGSGLYLGTLWGAGLAALGYGVRYFVKTRML